MINPSEVAREALRQLAQQRIPPTPDNYRILYLKISGERDPTSVQNPGSDPIKHFSDIIAALPRQTTADEKLFAQCHQALEKQHWSLLTKLLAQALQSASAVGRFDWAKLVQQLVEGLDSRPANLTPTQKKNALDRVLKSSQGNAVLFERLRYLIAQWTEQKLPENRARPESLPAGDEPRSVEKQPDQDLIRQACADLLDNVFASILVDSPKLAEESKALAEKIRGVSLSSADDLLSSLRRFALRIEYFVEDQFEMRAGLIHLLQLIVENMGELVIDDKWLTGQMEVLRTIVSGPLDARSIDSAERRLKEVLFKQSQLKHGLLEAQSTIKTLLAGFVDQLSIFAQSAGAYHDKIDACGRKISEVRDITQLENVIDEVMLETKTIQFKTLRMRDELETNRARVSEAERRIEQLEKELSSTSEMVRHDQLTGALNRRGLEEVFDKEIARAARHKSPICLAVIDVDDFKKLNDSLGHQAGDSALTHLVATIRDTIRPQDTVARYGGEEFVVLLPDTQLEEAQSVMIRVQRELTKRFFMHDNRKVLITFSAGVTLLPANETREQAIKRADELMYEAKRSGKNKVVASGPAMNLSASE